MSKKRKLEQRASKRQQDAYFAELDELAQQKINGEEPEPKKRGLLDIVRGGKPDVGDSDLKGPEGISDEEPMEAIPEKEPTMVTPQSEQARVAQEPTNVAPGEPPAWARDLVASQKAFQENVGSVIAKTAKILDAHDLRFNELEERILNLEDWRRAAMKAEQAKAETEVRNEAKEAEVEANEEAAEAEAKEAGLIKVTEAEPGQIELVVEVEPEAESKPEPEVELEPEPDEDDLSPEMWWQGKIVDENGKISYSHPFRNIFVAEEFATTKKKKTKPAFVMVNASGEIQRRMTKEELAEYGHLF